MHFHRRHLTRLLLASACTLAALSAIPAGALAEVDPLSATLDNGSFGEFSQTNVDEGTLSLTDERYYDGGLSARATYDGEGENGYSRGIWNVEWNDGEDVWFGAAYFLPVGFHSNIQGQVDLLRWDNWESHPDDTDWGGVGIYGSDRRARVLLMGAGRDSDVVVSPFRLPEGRWFTLEVHQRLSAGAGALSEVYLDGALVGRSEKPNTYGRKIERIRYGIVAIAEGEQRKPLDLWFDRATAGPETAAPAPLSRPDISRTRSRPRPKKCASRRHLANHGRACLNRRVALPAPRRNG
jgi:hypothetical protein